MTTTRRKVTFEYVSATVHPEYYRGDQPKVVWHQVPDEHWQTSERQGEPADIADQHKGLIGLIAKGELIRNVHMYEAQVPPPDWREVTS